MARFWFSFVLSVALGFVLSGCQVDTPIIKPVAGEHYAPIVVDISVPKGEIHYTLDGSEPNRESQRYSGPFKIESGNVTVKAKAFDRFMGVEVASGVSSAAFNAVVLTLPTISPKSGKYQAPLEVAIASGGGVIRYTLDGSTPTVESLRYEKPLILEPGSFVLKAKEFRALDGDTRASETAESKFRVEWPLPEQRAVVNYLEKALVDSTSYKPLSFGPVIKADGVELRAIRHVYKANNRLGVGLNSSDWFVFGDKNEIIFHLDEEPERTFVKLLEDESSSVSGFFYRAILYPQPIALSMYKRGEREAACTDFANHLRSLNSGDMARATDALQQNRFTGAEYTKLIYFMRIFPKAVCSEL